MGTNKRYPGTLAREIEEAAVRAHPVGLSPEEIDEEHFPITRQVSIPVRAWVRFHADALIQPDCVVIAFNSKAVQISFRNRQGQEITTWVYASAVERRDVRDR